MKKLYFLIILFFTSKQFTPEEQKKLEDLDHYLYQIEDKVDHLLYHHGHDVTRHAAEYTPWGFTYVPKPKDPNSIHHKLTIVDYLQNHVNNPYSQGMNNPYFNMMMTPFNLALGAQTMGQTNNMANPGIM
jgi:hypothetical protein